MIVVDMELEDVEKDDNEKKALMGYT